MAKFAKGDHVRWNSEAGHVTGHIERYVSGCQGVNTCGYGDTRTVMLKIGKEW